MTDLFAPPDPAEMRGAIISGCGTYRYHLWRRWDTDLPTMIFVMLNPSKADAVDDDPTIRRCIGFAKRERCGGISVRNVFALRSTDPKALLTHPDPVGPDNYEHLIHARGCSLLTVMVAAWGKRVGGKRLRDGYCNAAAACCINKAYCLGTTKDGDPRHPLYLPANAPLARFKMPSY